MKRFKSKKIKNNNSLNIFMIIILSIIMINYYDKRISEKIVDIASSKLEEITTLYIKRDIVPTNIELNKLIDVITNENNEIIYIDIDMDYSRVLLIDIVSKIQNNILLLEKGAIENFDNSNEVKSFKNNLYLEIPLQTYRKGVLLNSIGPKIPIKMSFYEHVLGNIDTKVEEYGINNAIIKVVFDIELEQKIILPYKEEKIKRNYSLVLGSKVIPGKVPSLYNGSYNKTSSILEF